MVKKRLASGELCSESVEAEDALRAAGLWARIDKVVWAIEDETDSLGWELARQHQAETVPFFIVAESDSVSVYSSTSVLIEKLAATGDAPKPRRPNGAHAEVAVKTSVEVAQALSDDAVIIAELELEGAEPQAILEWALSTYGRQTAIAFSGAEDVVLIHMASQLGLKYSAVTIDTGRLHPETYEFVDWVRERYGFDLIVTAPDRVELETLVGTKGLFSFYRDGHAECCRVRKVDPLRRVLDGRPAWITGQRRDQSFETRSQLPLVQRDTHMATAGKQLVKINPLAAWSAETVWAFIRENELPHNPLHGRGFASIGCAPCTRPILPGQSARDGRWWWEGDGAKECGLHPQNLKVRRPTPTDEP